MAHLESRIGLFCRALWLVQGDLLDVRLAGAKEGVALALGLEGLGFRDDASSYEAVGSFLAGGRSLGDLVTLLANSLFILERGHPVLRQGADLHRLIRVVDPDVLATLWPELQPSSGDGFDWPVVPMDDGGSISGLLRKGSTETHIHLGGALPPVFYWLLLMGGELRLDQAGKIRSEARGHASADAWSDALHKASWRRYHLAAHLETLAEQASMPPVFPHLAGSELWEGFRVAEPPDNFEIRERVAALASAGSRRERRREPGYFAEPLRAQAAGGCCHYASGERRLLYHLRRLLDRPELFHKAKDKRAALETELLSYLRVRNAFHMLMVHDYGTDGLLRFVEAFQRRGLGEEKTLRNGRSARRKRARRMALRLERIRMAAALDCQLLDPFDPSERAGCAAPPRCIEMRVSVPHGPQALRTLRAWIEGIADHLRAGRQEVSLQGSHIGLAFHVLKKQKEMASKARADAERLCQFLKEFPHFRPFVVGFDGAGKERNAVPRDFLQAFHSVQQLVEHHRPAPGLPPIRLGFTYHVGEDVVDLLTGLRHIDETASLLLPRSVGGRLGHALALGDDPERFYGNRGYQTEPALGAHLLDLVWAWGRLSETDGASRCQKLQRRISSLSGHSIDERRIARCYEEMGLEAPAPPCLEADLLKVLNVENAASPVVVQADEDWRKLIRELQALLQRRLALRRICIEANPSSNLIIGGYSDYAQLPYVRLVEAGLPLSINTDDPGLFMTSLPGELAALYATWEGKKPHREILAWLADRVFDAEQSTFLGARHHPSFHGWEEADMDRIFSPVRDE